jgi:hypothetical protein
MNHVISATEFRLQDSQVKGIVLSDRSSVWNGKLLCCGIYPVYTLYETTVGPQNDQEVRKFHNICSFVYIRYYTIKMIEYNDKESKFTKPIILSHIFTFLNIYYYYHYFIFMNKLLRA